MQSFPKEAEDGFKTIFNARKGKSSLQFSASSFQIPVQRVLFVANRAVSHSTSLHNPPEGVVVDEGNDYITYGYISWRQFTVISQGMGSKRVSSQSCTHPEIRLRYYSEKSNQIVMKSHNSQQLYQSTKTELALRMCRSNVAEKSNNSGKDVCKSEISQQVISSTKAGEKMVTSDRLECVKQPSISPTFKMEMAEVIRNSICKGEWVVSVDLTDAYFPHSSKISKSSAISCGRSFVSVQSDTFWYTNGSTQNHPCCQRSKAYALKQRHLDTPVYRRLVTLGPISPDLHGTFKTTGCVSSRFRLDNQLQKFGVNTNSKIRFPRVQIRLKQGQSFTHRK